MTFTCLSRDEVRKRFAQAENKAAEIRILADLTSATPKEVARFLGVIWPMRSKRGGRLDEERAMRLYNAGYSDREIADACSVCVYMVEQWRRRNSLYRDKALFDPEKIEELYRKGLHDGEIAAELHCSRGVAARWRRINNLPPNWDPHQKRKRRKRDSAKL